MKNVTIIVPVYKDWESLEICLNSLKEFVDPRHKIMLVNDKGPDWRVLEARILENIKGCSSFRYFANPENLGFVKTCNRAVFELDGTENDILLLNSDTRVTAGFLDEMQQVLGICERHGVVCPRSNHATILTMPVRNSLGRPFSEAESYAVFCQVQPVLPRCSVIPTGVGFAFLVKRELIKLFGMFDDIYSPGYGEENDFCMRISQYGYNVVMANRAYVYHLESRSFGKKRNSIEAEHHKLLTDRYPYYSDLVSGYLQNGIHPAEYFADLLAEGVYPKKRLLFSLYEIPAAYNGTSQCGLSLLKHFYRMYQNKYEIHILISRKADDYFRISDSYANVWYPDHIEGTFHLAYSPSQIFHMEHLLLLNRVSLKYVFCMQDIISLRCGYLRASEWERHDIFAKSIQYCAGLTFISKFSLQDTNSYYQELFSRREIKARVVYHGTEIQTASAAGQSLPFEAYYLVIGNFYKHKFMEEILPYLKPDIGNFILLGSKETGRFSENIYGFRSGKLPAELVDQLISGAKAILFPSVYEGFGLPILDAMKFGKRILVYNSELNRELKQVFHRFSDHIYLFDVPDDLERMLYEIRRDLDEYAKDDSQPVRTWTEAAKELEAFLEDILSDPADVGLLTQRWEDLRCMEVMLQKNTVGRSRAERKAGAVLRLKIYLHDHYPRVFLFLRKWKRVFINSGK